jgi:hypothetical protein
MRTSTTNCERYLHGLPLPPHLRHRELHAADAELPVRRHKEHVRPHDAASSAGQTTRAEPSRRSLLGTWTWNTTAKQCDNNTCTIINDDNSCYNQTGCTWETFVTPNVCVPQTCQYPA